MRADMLKAIWEKIAVMDHTMGLMEGHVTFIGGSISIMEGILQNIEDYFNSMDSTFKTNSQVVPSEQFSNAPTHRHNLAIIEEDEDLRSCLEEAVLCLVLMMSI